MVNLGRVGGYCIIIGGMLILVIVPLLSPWLELNTLLVSNPGLPGTSVDTGFDIFALQSFFTITWAAIGLIGVFFVAKGKQAGLLLVLMAGVLGIAGAFTPVLAVNVALLWNSAGINHGYTIVDGATLYLSSRFWYGSIAMVAGSILLLASKQEWRPRWIRDHVSRMIKKVRQLRSAAARDKTRAVVVAGMICCLAATVVMNLHVYDASQPHYPVYSYPAPPPGKTWIKVESGPTPVTNPLKGFMPYANSGLTFPHSMEYSYFSLRSIATSNSTGVFNFSVIETFLSQVSGRGHQSVFRIYLDYPGSATGVPQYLIDAGVEMHHYTEEGGGYSPNYDDPRVVAEMVACIHVLGIQYDDDTRVGFIEAGFLGKWGEWHTSPQSSWFANETTQRAVLQAYHDAFKTTWILARYPSSVTRDYQLGFHDDSFSYATLLTEHSQDWYFWIQMTKMGMTDVWQRAPIGGEVRPESQASIFRSPPTGGQDFTDCVYTTHASWMLMSAVFHPTAPWANMSDTDLDRAKNGSGLMGYDLKACWVNYTYAAASNDLAVAVVVANFGVAPFYYNWTAQFGVFNQTKGLVRQYDTPASILGILPGQYATWTVTLGGILPSFTGGFIAVRVPNVLPNGSPVVFSNKNIFPGNWTSLCKFILSSVPDDRDTRFTDRILDVMRDTS